MSKMYSLSFAFGCFRVVFLLDCSSVYSSVRLLGLVRISQVIGPEGLVVCTSQEIGCEDRL